MNLPQYIQAHAGRLRFKPSDRLRKLGFVREQLVHPDGTPMTKASEAMAWLESVFEPRLKAVLEARSPKKAAKTRQPGAKITVGDACEVFIASVGFGELRAKTRQDYAAKLHWLERFDADLWGRRLDIIDRNMAKGLWRAIKNGKPHPKSKPGRELWLFKPSHSMANGVLAVLRCVWKHAHENKHVGHDNQFGALDLTDTPPRVRVWSADELQVMLAVADEIDPETGRPRDAEMGDAILLAHELGQRQGDILKLTWTDVDADGRFLIVQNKTLARVAVRPQPELVARLEDARRRRDEIVERLGKGRPSGHARRAIAGRAVSPTIVLTYHKGLPICRSACGHRFDALRAIAAKRLPSCATMTFQDLRDTCVTNMADAGATDLEIASVTGHSLTNVSDVLRHYHKRTVAQTDNAMDKVRAYRDRLAAERAVAA